MINFSNTRCRRTLTCYLLNVLRNCTNRSPELKHKGKLENLFTFDGMRLHEKICCRRRPLAPIFPWGLTLFNKNTTTITNITPVNNER